MKHALRLTVLFVLAIAAPTTAFQRVFPCRVDYRKPASFWDEVTWDPNPGQGVLVGQLDAYPREDVLVLDNRPQGARGVLHLFLGSGDGTFTPHSSQGLPGAAYGLDGADADGDGDIDAVTALRWLGAEDSVAVCRNDGNADFAITSYGVGTSPADVVLRDVSDNPGWPDIVTANYGANTITCRYNDAAGNFPTRQDFATGNGPVAIVVCRMDADEWNDVVTANFGSGDVSVLVNSDGLGLFPEHEEFPAVPYPGDMAAGDLNGDGLSDVVVVSGHSEEQNPIEFLGVLLNDGAGGLLPPVLYRVGEFHYGVRVADLDGDLDLDIVATAIGGGRVDILYNDGNGSFQPSLTYATCRLPVALDLADVEGDNRPDLIAVGWNRLSVALDDGIGGFQRGVQYQSGTTSSGLAVTDYSGDGVLDAGVVNTHSQDVAAFENTGLGTFMTPPPRYGTLILEPLSICAEDIDGDLWDDLATAGWRQVELKWNDGSGGFAEAYPCGVPGRNGPGLCVADVDNDLARDLDVVTTYRYPADAPEPQWNVVVQEYAFGGGLAYRDTTIEYSWSGHDEVEQGLVVLENLGDRRLGYPVYYPLPSSTPVNCYLLAPADINADGYVDVCVAEGTGLRVWYNNGQGGYTASVWFPTGLESYSVATGYLNDDNLVDVVVGSLATSPWDGLAVLLNTGSGLSLQQVYETDFGWVSCCVADVDGDGDSDIMATNVNGQNAALLLNAGDASFVSPYYLYGLNRFPHALVLADVDDDGDDDAVSLTSRAFSPDNFLVVNTNVLNCVSQSSYPKMTYPNQGRHIARAPNSLCRDVVYQSNYGVFWRWFGEGINGPVTRLDVGSYPTTAKNTDPATWVAYSHAGGQALRSAIQRPGATWKYCSVGTAPSLSAPSLVLSKTVGVSNSGDLGYVVYPVRDAALNLSQVCIRAYDSLGVYYTGVLAFGDIGESEVLTPSIAVTPGDFLHVVWCQGGRVYCKSTLQPVLPEAIRAGMPPGWSGPMPVSNQPTEPAANCFIEAQGEFIYVVWRGPNAQGQNIGEVYRRDALLDPPGQPLWLPIQTVSESPTQQSDYPVQATGLASVWQEDMPMTGNREILARLDAGIVNLSNTGGLSSYPHSELMPAPPPGQWRLFTIWTEEVVPNSQYQVRWSNYDLSGFDGPPMMSFLNVAVGESIQSQYCLERQGFDRSMRYPCDYSESRLIYRLPYMNPRKYYMLEAMGYQNKESQTRQRVSLGGRSWDVTLRRDRPETLQVALPRGIYDSTAVMLRLERLAGQRVVLAGLKLYEFEVIEKEGGGALSRPQQRRVTEPALTAYPNPFSRSLSVSYALPRAGMAAVKVFDISGREVRCLVNGAVPAGVRTLVYDGRDNRGRALPAGVYLLRLDAEGKVLTEKVIMSR